MARLSKQERRRLAEQEVAARQQSRLAEAPLGRDELDSLYAFVAERVASVGHDKTLEITQEYLATSGLDAAAVTSFLQSQQIMTDWDVLMRADPHKLFGPTATRLARMPLDPAELTNLIDAVDEAVRAEGCDHDLGFTRGWLELNELPIATTEFALIAQGGGCDCEVVLNVDHELIYPAGMLGEADE